MTIQHNISLKKYNTFGISAKAKYFCHVINLEDLKTVLLQNEYPRKLFIGGGSNMLLTGDIDALVIHIDIKGKEIISETEEHVILKVMAGENWHEMILWCLEKDFGGLENMSLIPGNTGTAPIQNIGAYGVELKDVFQTCEAMNIQNQEIQIFSKKSCNFGYRDSYFKNDGKGKYIITSVTFKLSKKHHTMNTSYGAIEAELEKQNINTPTIKDISNAVIAIRQSKLPDPKKLGNSGSFFKNPVISKADFDKFLQNNPSAPFYELTNNTYKVPAGWLIEQCGFKGKRFGDAGVHEHQALVLVNHDNATGNEILTLANKIINAVKEKFSINIIPEVNIIK